MRHWLSALFVALLLFLPFPSVANPQAAEQSQTASTRATTPPPDISGIWTTHEPRDVGWYNYALAGPDVPMTPWAEAEFKASRPSFGPHNYEDSNDPAYACLPPGPLRVYAFVGAEMQIVSVPGRVLILFGRDIRQVYTDGRAHPKNLAAKWMGDSIGSWDGDTFVVDTVGINDRNWIDRMGHPHSDQLHVVERFRRVEANTLNLDITLDDPKAFSKSWTAQRTFRLQPPGTREVERFCEDIFVNEAFGLKPILPSKK